MFNETSYGLGYMTPSGWGGAPIWERGPYDKAPELLGPPVADSGVVHTLPGYGGGNHRCSPMGMTAGMPGRFIYPPGCLVETPYLAPGPPQGPPVVVPVTTPTTTLPVAPTGGFDLSSITSMLGGTTFGLPTWLIAGGAAWFFFFRKGR